MADIIQSQYMDLPVPIPTVDPGPQYATDINSCLALIDQHDHSVDKGTPVTPAGMNINLDLEFNGNNATELRSTRFDVQPSPISAPTDLGCTYVSGVDLYYNDVNGNQVRITQSGAIAGTPGSIGGLTPPASVTYNSGTSTFIFQSTTATPANLDAASIIIRELVANGKGVTLSAPAALAANYTLTMPSSLATSSSFVTSDPSGNLSYTAPDDNTVQISGTHLQVKDHGITQIKRSLATSGNTATAGNFALSESCGSFSITSATEAQVTNLAVTITTTGRPVRVELIPADGGSQSFVSVTPETSACSVFFNSNGNRIATNVFEIIASAPAVLATAPWSTVTFPASSSYTYTVTARSGPAATLSIRDIKLLAYEL